MNPLFNMLGGGSPMGGIMPGMGGGNNPMQMIQKFMEFKKNFRGNPQEEVQKMLQSGQITQQQLDRAQQMARQFQQMLNSMKK
ncbi:DUF4175 domain-containing protein [Enterocloster citroniae]|jgi:hypothetical protein|uniref:DUF4175 domain-containing protein n=1 Tax=Enterocloster citroniae TaxID=358743 RepID=UPI001D13F3D0|nr:DUF4175 domain-containing protein [Enterocloster citroniae]